MKRYLLACALVSFIFLTACERDRIILIGANAQQQQKSVFAITEHEFVVAQPCLVTEQEKTAHTYATAKISISALVSFPDKAKTEHVEGCAGVKFHLKKDGSATDVQIVRESIQGYEFGVLTQHEVEATVYQTPVDEDKWYYQTNVLTFLDRGTKIFSGGPDQFAKYAEQFGRN